MRTEEQRDYEEYEQKVLEMLLKVLNAYEEQKIDKDTFKENVEMLVNELRPEEQEKAMALVRF
jgi:hypothetical protein